MESGRNFFSGRIKAAAKGGFASAAISLLLACSPGDHDLVPADFSYKDFEPGTRAPVDASRVSGKGRIDARSIPEAFPGVSRFAMVRNPADARATLVWIPQFHRTYVLSDLEDFRDVHETAAVQQNIYRALNHLRTNFAVTHVAIEGLTEDGLLAPISKPQAPFWFGATDQLEGANILLARTLQACARSPVTWEALRPMFQAACEKNLGLGHDFEKKSRADKFRKIATEQSVTPCRENALPEEEAISTMTGVLSFLDVSISPSKPPEWDASDEELSQNLKRSLGYYSFYGLRGAGEILWRQGLLEPVNAESRDTYGESESAIRRLRRQNPGMDINQVFGLPEAREISFRKRESAAIEILANRALSTPSGILPFQFGCFHAFSDDVDRYNLAHPEAKIAYAIAVPVGIPVENIEDLKVSSGK